MNQDAGGGALAPIDWTPALLAAARAAESGFALYFLSNLQSPKGRAGMLSTLRQVLRRFFRFEGEPADFEWWRLRAIHTEALRAWLADNYAPSAANKALSGVRGILRRCYRLEQISERDYRLAVDVPAVRGERAQPGRFVPVGEVRAMFAAIKSHAERRGLADIGARDAAMLALLYGAGLRRAELVCLDRSSLDGDGLRLVGKGNKERRVPLPAGARAALAAWLACRGDDPGPLFFPTAGRRTRLQIGERLSDGDVYACVLHWARIAGVPKLSPHDLRRSYVSTLLDAGADLKTAADLTGHSSVETTARYDRRDERARVRAAELVCVPFD